MELNYNRYSSDGAPLLILHGMLGNFNNWSWHSRRLAEHFAVYALDMRNHGASPHAPQMDYPTMAQDVMAFMDQHGIDKAHILGHSMGGKIAMQLALNAPQRVLRLVVADVAPVEYQKGEHDDIFSGLDAIDLASVQSRTEADKQLAEWVDDEIVRQFLLSNLVREDDGFAWRINLPVIRDSYPLLRAAVSGEAGYQGEVLFVRGDRSDYVLPEYEAAITTLFPQAVIETIAPAGHWLHAEKPETFQRIVGGFLRGEA